MLLAPSAEELCIAGLPLLLPPAMSAPPFVRALLYAPMPELPGAAIGRDSEAGVVVAWVGPRLGPGTRFWNLSLLQYSSPSSRMALPWGLQDGRGKMVS